MRSTGFRAMLFQRLYDEAVVAALRDSLEKWAEENLGPGYSLVVQTETQSGVVTSE